MNSNKNNLLTNTLYISHMTFVYFIIFGCFLPSQYLWVHIICWPLVRLHWYLNDGYCVLTQLEYRLKKNTINKNANNNSDPEASFMKNIYENFTKTRMTNEEADVITTTLFTVVWIISVTRFIYYIQGKWFH
jgi:hypothetical protein